MRISDSLFRAYLQCKHGVLRALNGEVKVSSRYESIKDQLGRQAADAAQIALLRKLGLVTAHQSHHCTIDTLTHAHPLILNPLLETPLFAFHFDALQIREEPRKEHLHYIPILFSDPFTPPDHRKLLLAFGSIVLGEFQEEKPDVGLIFNDSSSTLTTVQLKKYEQDTNRILKELAYLAGQNHPPKAILGKYCNTCMFHDSCAANAQDSLCLLSGMSLAEIKKCNSRGIFTVNQLSYTFRPRKKGKYAKHQPRLYYHSLKALAIREKKVYVFQAPHLPVHATEVYVDMEGNQSSHSVYLIGVVTRQGSIEKEYSFWAEDAAQEPMIFSQFMTLLSGLHDARIFHYGSYETKVFKRMLPLAPSQEVADVLAVRSTNVLGCVYASVYYPTYSNSLKDIGGYLGSSWTVPPSFGAESIVWRKWWEGTREASIKESLLRYNLDDCRALQIIVLHLRSLFGKSPTEALASEEDAIALADKVLNPSEYKKWGPGEYATDDFKQLAECAYFDYQQSKIKLRSNATLRKLQRRASKKGILSHKPTRILEFAAGWCPYCTSTDIVRDNPHCLKKLTFDLRITQSGITRVVTECRAKELQCRECGKWFKPKSYLQQQRIGHNLLSWGMHQHIANRITFSNLATTVKECFGLNFGEWEFQRLKSIAAHYYTSTYDRLLRALITGCLLHIDETRVKLRGYITGYVWVFTNMESVVYMYRPTREGDFLHDLLKDFHGVLVTDFYTAYDSIECIQQKCLLHLMRDINDDLLKHAFDVDLKVIASSFGALMKNILKTVDSHGLRANVLSAHKQHVEKWLGDIGSATFSSPLADTYCKRIAKYRTKLFAFLNYDGVPWNNNNAEHAIKPFAKYRRLVQGRITQPGITDYLIMLSIYQTCAYRQISFFEFLKSQATDIDKYCGIESDREPGSVSV